MLNISWHEHISNKEVAARASRTEEYIVNKVQHRQHTWLGHVLRMEGKRLPKMSLQAHAHHTRYKGRPRKSWIDTHLKGQGWNSSLLFRWHIIEICGEVASAERTTVRSS